MQRDKSDNPGTLHTSGTPRKHLKQPLMKPAKTKPTLEHRFTFRTDFDTADKVVREARAKGVSVSKHINALLSK